MLGGMATIGAAGALGAGAWAGYSDTETASITVNAGTLDTVLYLENPDGSSSDRINGNVATLTVDNLAPGDVVEKDVRVGNIGSVDAHSVGVDIKNVQSGEGLTPESETDRATSNGGELENQLELLVDYSNATLHQLIGDENGSGPNTYVPFTTAANQPSGTYTAGGFTLPETGSVSEYDTLNVEMRYEDLDPSKNNKAMGDELTFDIEITLYQNDVTQTSP